LPNERKIKERWRSQNTTSRMEKPTIDINLGLVSRNMKEGGNLKVHF